MSDKPKTYRVAKGKRDFRPLDGFMPVWVVDGYHERWEVTWNEDCRYTLPGEDQQDWNKGGGLTLTLFGRECSGRWAWRYNPATDRIELASYYYVDNRRVVPRAEDGSEVQARVAIGQKATIEMWRDGNDLVIGYPGGAHTRQSYEYWPMVAREMGLFFGGANALDKPTRAPKDMSLELLKTRLK